MNLFLLVYAINLSNFQYQVFNDCNSYKLEVALLRFDEVLKAQESAGFKCKKVPDMYSYSCIANGKLVAIELHKDKKICKQVPAKTIKQIKFLMK